MQLWPLCPLYCETVILGLLWLLRHPSSRSKQLQGKLSFHVRFTSHYYFEVKLFIKLGQRRLISSSTLQSSMKGRQGKSSRQEHGDRNESRKHRVTLLTGFVSMACIACFLIQPSFVVCIIPLSFRLIPSPVCRPHKSLVAIAPVGISCLAGWCDSP